MLLRYSLQFMFLFFEQWCFLYDKDFKVNMWCQWTSVIASLDSAFIYDCVHHSVLGMDVSSESCSSQPPTLNRNKSMGWFVIGVRTSRLVYDVICLDLKGRVVQMWHCYNKGLMKTILWFYLLKFRVCLIELKTGR